MVDTIETVFCQALGPEVPSSLLPVFPCLEFVPHTSSQFNSISLPLLGFLNLPNKFDPQKSFSQLYDLVGCFRGGFLAGAGKRNVWGHVSVSLPCFIFN